MDPTLGRARLAQGSESCGDVRAIPGRIIKHAREEKRPSSPIEEEYFKHLQSIRLKIGAVSPRFSRQKLLWKTPVLQSGSFSEQELVQQALGRQDLGGALVRKLCILSGV